MFAIRFQCNVLFFSRNNFLANDLSRLGPGHTHLVKSFGQVIWLPLEIYFLYEEDALGIQDSKTPFLIRQSDEKLRPKNRLTKGLDQMT